MRTVRQLKDLLEGKEDTDLMWVYWLDKEDIHEHIENVYYEEVEEWRVKNAPNQDWGTTLSALLTKELIEEILRDIGDNDDVYEELSESFSEAVSSNLKDKLDRETNDEELWDTEMENA